MLNRQGGKTSNMVVWAQLVVTFLGMIFGSGFIQFLIIRKDNKNEKMKETQKKVEEKIKENEKLSSQRYLEHKEAIEKMNEAIIQLTKNDTDQTKYLKYVGDEIVGLAHDKLVCLGDKYQERGAITLKEKATLEAIYKPYHEGLGGNGDGQTSYEYCMKLPIVTNEKAKEMDNK